jgi:hypothetical protein
MNSRMNSLYISGRTEERPPPQIFGLLLFVSSVAMKRAPIRGNAFICTTVFVATKRTFREPLSRNGRFRHNIIFGLRKEFRKHWVFEAWYYVDQIILYFKLLSEILKVKREWKSITLPFAFYDCESWYLAFVKNRDWGCLRTEREKNIRKLDGMS